MDRLSTAGLSSCSGLVEGSVSSGGSRVIDVEGTVFLGKKKILIPFLLELAFLSRCFCTRMASLTRSQAARLLLLEE